MKKSQAWSMDIMLAVVIFIGAALFFYLILNNSQGTEINALQDDASKVINALVSDDSGIGIINGNEVNTTKLKDLLSEDYESIKQKLRIESEFCIFMEDGDGNIIYIDTNSEQNPTGIGSEIINVSDVPCG